MSSSGVLDVHHYHRYISQGVGCLNGVSFSSTCLIVLSINNIPRHIQTLLAFVVACKQIVTEHE